jgi:hypothetical protein
MLRRLSFPEAILSMNLMRFMAFSFPVCLPACGLAPTSPAVKRLVVLPWQWLEPTLIFASGQLGSLALP